MSAPPSKLPGFGIPLNFTSYDEGNYFDHNLTASRLVKKIFPNALSSFPPLTTLREFTMVRFMNQLTDKPGWEVKVFDEAIVAKWKAEVLDMMTERMFTYCIDELKYKSKIFKATGAIVAYDGAVVKSDIAIPSSLRYALRTAVATLEDVPPSLRDWHPGSDDMVLDLVHPSLFPVVYGRTRILGNSVVGLDDCVKRCGEGVTLCVPLHKEAQVAGRDVFQDPYSRKFQWLPCEVKFDGDKTKITSYINNLHPKTHKTLYGIIEQILDLTIPLWNQTLTPLRYTTSHPPRIMFSECIYDPDPDYLPQKQQPQRLPNESDDNYYERKWQWVVDTRQLVMPEPAVFKEPPEHAETVDLTKEFAKTGLQVIVKLANIQLTPEKPEYGGGTWHVEGQLNEHICATALYYYDSSNITESLLSFRQQSSTDYVDEISYPQEEHRWLSEVFGCEQDGPAIQYIGNVVTKEGRLLTFPNIFQHRVAGFGLLDKTKPGHRKILAFFLVDPNIKIISSANVPCQQKEWWSQDLLAGGVFSTLPNELVKEVVDSVEEFPIGLDEAKKLRAELMEERKMFVQRHDVHMESVTFSLCEH